MMVELIVLSVSAIGLILLYVGRMRSPEGETFLFSSRFLMRADDVIFDFFKFVFKLYALVTSNIASFFKAMPHKVVDNIHKTSHNVAVKSKTWVEGIKRDPAARGK